ncbi:MAG: tRNA (mo5U34)-methyltransferase [Acidobacteriota bacterium]|jgi:tRNA (mo5U34)-methyltransferase|nr:tRNA (mo5U34)-methyltransferase [Acidobacteriota bacterium]
MTREEIQARVERLGPWFHCIDLGGGLQTKTVSAIGEPVEHPRPTWEKVRACLPEELAGRSVLDVGCNAGFYAVELKRRGAGRVLGVDSQRNLIRQAGFVRDVLGLDIEYRRASVYDLDPRELGQFDVTLALGLVYHCKHLVLALERLFAVTRDLLILETAIYPPERSPGTFTYEVGGLRPLLHPLAYVENETEAKEAIYNWFLPSIEALRALLKNIGFDEVEVFPATQSDRTILACRKREPYPDSRAISYLAASLAVEEGPSSCRPGEVLSFRVRAENTGLARWLRVGEPETDRGAVHLVAHVFGEGDEPLSWYHAGAYLPADVAPGETASIEIAIRAPETPGRYWLEFDMVSEHLAWFEDLGSAVLRHELTVE